MKKFVKQTIIFIVSMLVFALGISSTVEGVLF